MKNNNIPLPHGGLLINRIIPEVERESFIERALKHKIYTISNADVSVFYRIADGALSPLEGPMGRDEFITVLEKEIIIRDNKENAWTIPMIRYIPIMAIICLLLKDSKETKFEKP